jgi:hypothetical protein
MSAPRNRVSAPLQVGNLLAALLAAVAARTAPTVTLRAD